LRELGTAYILKEAFGILSALRSWLYVGSPPSEIKQWWKNAL